MKPISPWRARGLTIARYLATLAWALFAVFAGQFVALAAVVRWWPGNWAAHLSDFDGALVTVEILVSDPITVVLIALGVRIAGARQAEYLGLAWPRPRDVLTGLLGIAVVIAAGDAWVFAMGLPLVTDFQLDSYISGGREGVLAALWAASVIVAPAAEEVVFRGFLFRGLVRSERSAWPAIAFISLLWAALHVQYQWPYLLQIFVAGLFLGWVRWRSGSTLLTFLLHAVFNIEGMIETVLTLHFHPVR